MNTAQYRRRFAAADAIVAAVKRIDDANGIGLITLRSALVAHVAPAVLEQIATGLRNAADSYELPAS